jgi:hypothetical protein
MRSVRSILGLGLMVGVCVAIAGSTSLDAQKVTATKKGDGGSPHETVEYMVHGAKISIAYGRPFIKDRPIEKVAPAGQPYRLGADEATTLTTDKTLMVGSLSVPAGSYTLFAIPSDAGWKLAISKQTGQWGTDYDPKQDLGRVDLKKSTTPKAQENFTITLEEKPSDKGTINFDWGTTRLSSDFMVHSGT